MRVPLKTQKISPGQQRQLIFPFGRIFPAIRSESSINFCQNFMELQFDFGLSSFQHSKLHVNCFENYVRANSSQNFEICYHEIYFFVFQKYCKNFFYKIREYTRWNLKKKFFRRMQIISLETPCEFSIEILSEFLW